MMDWRIDKVKRGYRGVGSGRKQRMMVAISGSTQLNANHAANDRPMRLARRPVVKGTAKMNISAIDPTYTNSMLKRL